MAEATNSAQSHEGGWWPFWVGAVIFFAGAVAFLPGVLRPGVTQPVGFDHRKHTEKAEIECESCHSSVRTQAFAGLPKISFCMECHEEAQTNSPDEARLREYAHGGKEILWARLFRVPGHVYFSHRRHVALGSIGCNRCHGDIGHRLATDTRRPANLEMDECIACHQKEKAGVDCTDCHK